MLTGSTKVDVYQFSRSLKFVWRVLWGSGALSCCGSLFSLILREVLGVLLCDALRGKQTKKLQGCFSWTSRLDYPSAVSREKSLTSFLMTSAGLSAGKHANQC